MNSLKTIGLVLTVLVGVVADTNAATQVQFRWWNTAANNLMDNVNVAIPAGEATVLTYLSSDNTINFDAGTLLSASYGNDFFYQALGNGLPGRLTTTYMTDTSYVGYFAYAVVLDLNYTTFTTTYGGNVANVPIGTYFAITGVFGGLGNVAAETPAPPDDFNAGNLKTQTSVIPEPATAMLLAVGASIAWLIRLKQRLS